MISYQVYKIIHITGIALLYMGLGGILLASASSGAIKGKAKLLGMVGHGVGLVFILVSGFGMLARLGIIQGGMPGWVYAKLVIWGLAGIFVSVAKRKAQHAGTVFVLFMALATTAAYVAIYKPF